MPTQVRRQIARLLSNKRHRHEYLAALALLALVVTVGVASILTQQGHAATKEVQVLDCHFDGIAAHTVLHGRNFACRELRPLARAKALVSSNSSDCLFSTVENRPRRSNPYKGDGGSRLDSGQETLN